MLILLNKLWSVPSVDLGKDVQTGIGIAYGKLYLKLKSFSLSGNRLKLYHERVYQYIYILSMNEMKKTVIHP